MSARLAIGPANYAGQAYAWAEAVNTHLDASAFAFTPNRLRQGGFQFRAHKRIPAPYYYAPFGRDLRASLLLRGASHVILDGYRTVFYDRNPAAFKRQAASLARRGFTVGLLGHGDDVRDPEAHIARFKHSFYLEGDDDYRRHWITTSARNRDAARALGVPLFVSTPDMLHDLPEATWVPVCLDVDEWTTERRLLDGKRPRVLFVPSQRKPPTKGTQYVDPVLRRLHERGVIEYVAPNNVPHEQMRELVKSVDIVVDQLLFGSYGVAAIEAMAAGRIVLGNITDLTTALMPELPFVLNATPDDVEQVLLDALDDTDRLRTAAASNIEFVRRWHDGRESARQLAGFLGVAQTR